MGGGGSSAAADDLVVIIHLRRLTPKINLRKFILFLNDHIKWMPYRPIGCQEASHDPPAALHHPHQEETPVKVAAPLPPRLPRPPPGPGTGLGPGGLW